jgi:hypothetical protein
MTVSYRQPLLRTKGESRFFYLPMFTNLPRDISTTNTNRYAVTITSSGGTLRINMAGEDVTVGNSKTVTLAPKGLEPIRARLVPMSNHPAAGKAGFALLFAFVRHRPGLPEPGR